VRTKFGLRRLTMVGDRGMITLARIHALREDPDWAASEIPDKRLVV
jgi:hypothetical protein